MADIPAQIARLEGFTAEQRTAPHGSARMYAAMMTAGAADGYRLALADVAEWLRKRGNHGVAADLERLGRTTPSTSAGGKTDA
ncbi:MULTISPECIES: hypothetical protein [Methylorubrum]|uniref:hypothetical protein n=1 Tax=Methylorubrum TaxID=2282523 RepID=UPI00209F7C78|nr:MULTISPECIES: hypothetical protein [Methylorubrum]MCP1550647.1 hypothetical protein [Methylorubrum zatmanii]MCP1552740.1 hypothetical protein [Methylorubrum extorquens]MCP1580950.1 hypothetical protein [Methylorubrum extorquens]